MDNMENLDTLVTENPDAFETENPTQTAEQVDCKPVKKAFSGIGWALCAIIAATFAVQFVLKLVIKAFWPDGCWLTDSSTGMWLLTFVPMYLIAFPAGLLVMKHIPAEAPTACKMTAKEFWTYLPICFFLTYCGSILGNVLSSVLSGGEAQNALNAFATDTNPLKILFMVVLAPLLEELIFRKLLIDRTRVYGEKAAVFLSALTFALFHTNLFQFFYAFLVGWLFAYIYVRTGKLRYCAIMHGIVNFVGSVIAPLVLSSMDMDALSQLDPNLPEEELLKVYSQILPGLLLYYLFSMALLAVWIIGLVFFLQQRKKLRWEPAKIQLPAQRGIAAAYLNGGMIVFILLSLTLTAASLFS